jgi:carbamoyl-phosphate synthase large subunit
MKRAKCLHILGGGLWQVPTVQLAKARGHRVLITDMFQERPAYQYADAHEVVDITDLEGTLASAKRHQIDGILCDTTDAGVPTMAYVAEQLGLPGIGFETALDFTNKLRMRQVTNAAGIPNPSFAEVTNRNDLGAAFTNVGLPLVLKPVDSQSSRGVHVVRSMDDANRVFDEALSFSRTRTLIAEGLLEGQEVTVESCCIAGEVFTIGISDKSHLAHHPMVANRLTYPADLPENVTTRIVEVNRSAIRSLGLETGITHAEYIVVGEQPFIVEIAARGGGSCVYSHIVPYLAGVDIPRLYMESVLGEPWTTSPVDGARAANLEFFDIPPGRLEAVEGLDEARSLPGVEQVLLEVEPGDVVHQADDDRSRPGQIVTFGNTRAEVLETTARAMETIHFHVA